MVHHNVGNVSFYQKSESKDYEKKPKKDMSHHLCFRCGQYEDHYKNECRYNTDKAGKLKAIRPNHDVRKKISMGTVIRRDGYVCYIVAFVLHVVSKYLKYKM